MTTVALLGDTGHGKSTLARALAALGAPFAPGDPPDWSTPAAWGGAIWLVSVVDGVTRGGREQLAVAAQSGVTNLAVFLSKLDLVEDRELVDLVELEVRETVAKDGRQPPEQVRLVRGSALRALGGDARAAQAVMSLATLLVDGGLGAAGGVRPGARVLVAWADGRSYPGVVEQLGPGGCLVTFQDGQRRWIDPAYVSLA